MQIYDKKPNPCFCDAAGEYLEANGFVRSDRKIINDAIYFFKDGIGVVIYGDNADFMEQHSGELKRFAAHTGISSLTLFDWMLLLHITKVITIKTFMAAAKKEDPGITALDLVQSLFGHFKVTDDKDALPLNY